MVKKAIRTHVRNNYKCTKKDIIKWTTTVENGEPELLFMAKDYATLLGYSDHKRAIQKHVRSLYKCTKADIVQWSTRIDKMSTLKNSDKQTIFITEFGLYSLMMRSKMPKAEEFQNCVYRLVQNCVKFSFFF